jgi:hypothetical protein
LDKNDKNNLLLRCCGHKNNAATFPMTIATCGFRIFLDFAVFCPKMRENMKKRTLIW